MPTISERQDIGSVVSIKRRCNEVILSRLPVWKQNNLIARQAELDAIAAGRAVAADGTIEAARDWTAEEKQELAAIRGLWNWVSSMREASDQFEAALLSGGDPDYLPRASWPPYPY